MYKITSLLLTTLLFVINSYAQTEILVKFEDNKDLYENDYKYGKKYKIKVENINRFIYTVKSEKSEQDFNIEKPEIFKGIKLPGFLSMSAPTIPKKAPIEGQIQPDPADVLKKIKASYDNIKKLALRINNTGYLTLVVNNLISDCKKDFTTIESELKKGVDDYMNPGPAGTSLADATSKLSTMLEGYITSAKSELSTLENATDLMLELIKEENVKQNDIRIAIEYNIHDEEIKCKTPCPVSDNLKKLKDQLRKTTDKITALNSTKESLVTNLKEADTAVTEMKNFEKNGDLKKLMSAIASVNVNNFTFETEVFKAKKDEIIFTITSESEKPLSCNLPKSRVIKIEGRTYGGLKIDFSTGAFINSGREDFLGPEFYYKKVNDSTSIIQRVDRGKNLLLSVGGLMHFYYNFKSWIKPSLNIGVSTSSGFDLLNFHGGFSLILGDKQRLILSGGITLRQSKLLDTKYILDKEYPTKELPEAVPTASVFPQSGGFFAVTYNLSRLK